MLLGLEAEYVDEVWVSRGVKVQAEAEARRRR